MTVRATKLWGPLPPPQAKGAAPLETQRICGNPCLQPPMGPQNDSWTGKHVTARARLLEGRATEQTKSGLARSSTGGLAAPFVAFSRDGKRRNFVHGELNDRELPRVGSSLHGPDTLGPGPCQTARHGPFARCSARLADAFVTAQWPTGSPAVWRVNEKSRGTPQFATYTGPVRGKPRSFQRPTVRPTFLTLGAGGKRKVKVAKLGGISA